MERRKVSHHRRIRSSKIINIGDVRRLDIIRFTYHSKNAYDNLPLVFVTARIGDYIEGFNLNYMKEFAVQKLLKEIPKRLSAQNLTKYQSSSYNVFKKSFRTYIKKDMFKVEYITYDTDDMIAARKNIKGQTVDKTQEKIEKVTEVIAKNTKKELIKRTKNKQ